MKTIIPRFNLGKTTLSLLFISLTLSLSGCDAKPTIFKVEATQGFCDSGFDAWDKPTCSGDMKPAGVIDFTLDAASKTVTAELIQPNQFAGRTLLSRFENCQITDALNWSCESQNQHFIKVKQGHYHYYTLNEDTTLSHFIGKVVEKPATAN